TGREHLGVRGRPVVDQVARVRAGQSGVAGAHADPQLLGDQDEFAGPTARAPVTSSPACATPVKSQPTGSGQGIHTGTFARTVATPSASTLGGTTGCRGYTVPCVSHCQSSEKRPGARTLPPHLGQLGSPLIGANGPLSRRARQGRSPTRAHPSVEGRAAHAHAPHPMSAPR